MALCKSWFTCFVYFEVFRQVRSHEIAGADEGFQITRRQALLIHAKFNRLNRIGGRHGVMLVFILFNAQRKNF